MPLAQQLDEGDGIQNKDLKVNEVINFEGKRWEINKLQILLPIDFIPRILGSPILNDRNTDDPMWSPNPSGKFTVKSAYNWLIFRDQNCCFPQIPWLRIWKLPCAPKNQEFHIASHS